MRNVLLFLCLAFAHFLSFSQCTNHEIIISKTSGCAPQLIKIYVTNAEAAATIQWNVENEKFIGKDTIYHFYDEEIIVTPKAIITHTTNSQCSIESSTPIEIFGKTEPQIQLPFKYLCYGPDTATFLDITPNVKSRNWIIDGTYYNDASFKRTHKFTTEGEKDVSLIITDSNGCKATKSFKNAIEIMPNLQFDFESDIQTGCLPQSIKYQLLSNPSSNYTKSYQWTFEGAETLVDSNQNPANAVYAHSGLFNTEINVTLNNGCTYNQSRSAYIKIGEQDTVSLYSSQSEYCVGDTIIVTIDSKYLAQKTVWELEGNVETINESNSYITLLAKDTGEININMTSENNGCTNITKSPIKLHVNGVLVDFTSNDNFHCDVPHTVHLENKTQELNSSNVTYLWEILQNQDRIYASTNYNDSFTFYKMPATYDVLLTANTSEGCEVKKIKKGFIYQDPLKIKMQPMPQIGCLGQEIEFLNITKPSSYKSADDFKWYFYDKNETTILDSSSLRSPKITYQDTGYYPIYITAKNGISCHDTIWLDSAIRIIKPELDYSISDTIICLGDTISLNGLTTPKEANFKHVWQLVDNNASATKQGVELLTTGQKVNIIPLHAGDYSIVYNHEIAGGCKEFDTTLLHVNELKADILLDTTSGCSPLIVNPRLQVIKNLHYGFESNSILQNWNANPSLGSRSSGNKSDNPVFIFLADGLYNILDNIENSAGCKYNASSHLISVGVNADFSLSKQNYCLGDKVTVYDNSSPSKTNVQWVLSPNVKIKPEFVSDKEIAFANLPEGEYTITQIVDRDNKCFDVKTKRFKVIKVTADFELSDSLLLCAPVLAEFRSKSLNADTLLWDFGDGTNAVTTEINSGHIYTNNSGWTKKLDITLIAKNISGCTDTFTKKDYLLVKGPVPSFSYENLSGCEPLNISIENNSQDAIRTYANFKDGSPIAETTKNNNTFCHIYSSDQSKSLVTSYAIEMIVYDSLGCAAALELPDSVQIFKKPQINALTESTKNFCVPFNFRMQDNGDYASKWKWSLNDKVVTTKKTDEITISEHGDYTLELYAQNKYNCSDTFSQNFYAKESPIANFLSSGDFCQNEAVLLESKSKSSLPLEGIKWTFVDADIKTSTKQTVNLIFDSNGYKLITLEAKHQNKCTDNVQKSIYISNESDIDKPQIQYITYNEDNSLIINYDSSCYSKFQSYVLSKSGKQLDKVEDKKQTLYKEIFTLQPNDSFCYDIAVIDICEFMGKSSIKHCFISLAGESQKSGEVRLNWTPYSGWKSVKSYKIYRNSASGKYVQIASVSGDVFTYLDSNLCFQPYTYYVVATHPSEEWTSQSTYFNLTPRYDFNQNSSNIKNVSVSGPNQITVTWNKSLYKNTSHYILSKFQIVDNQEIFLEEIRIADTIVIDTDVDPSSYSYSYKLIEEDFCGYINESGRIGKSILLDGNYQSGNYSNNLSKGTLTWNKYLEWQNGVSNYQVEIKKESGFNHIGTVSGNVTQYIDKEFHKNEIGEYCYRVYATNNQGDTSFSNVLCLVGEPTFAIPNAFSPNKDGLNDRFRPIFQFVQNGIDVGAGSFDFTIYNRWGEIIFNSQQAEIGWDGTYKGELCPIGTYMYTLSFKSLKNRKTNYAGTVHLIY